MLNPLCPSRSVLSATPKRRKLGPQDFSRGSITTVSMPPCDSVRSVTCWKSSVAYSASTARSTSSSGGEVSLTASNTACTLCGSTYCRPSVLTSTAGGAPASDSRRGSLAARHASHSLSGTA